MKTNDNNKAIDISLNLIIIPKDNKNITDEHKSFINKLNSFMSNNSIYLEYNVPAAKDEKGQEILKKDEFWKKYISLININYLMNNQNKISLFSIMYLIEQYFIWCENTDSKSMNLFKQAIIEMIYKMYEINDINKFLETNRLNNLEELFDKYDYYIKNGNKKEQEIEIKIAPDNLECNCDMCTNEKYCLKKMSELNKQYNNENKVENLLINAAYPRKNKKEIKENNEIKSNNLINIKNDKEIFGESKAIYSFESSYQFIPSKNSPKKKRSSVNSAIKSNKKQSSGKKNRFNEEQSSSEKKRENSFDASNNRKIEEYFKSIKNQEINQVKSEKKREKSEKKKEKSEKKKGTSVNKSKNRRKSSNKKSSSNKAQKKYIDDIESENEENEERKKYQKKTTEKTNLS